MNLLYSKICRIVARGGSRDTKIPWFLYFSPSDVIEKVNLCQVAFTIFEHLSASVSICPKLWTGKYQDHLANDGVTSRMLNRKTNMTLSGN